MTCQTELDYDPRWCSRGHAIKQLLFLFQFSVATGDLNLFFLPVFNSVSHEDSYKALCCLRTHAQLMLLVSVWAHWEGVSFQF